MEWDYKTILGAAENITKSGAFGKLIFASGAKTDVKMLFQTTRGFGLNAMSDSGYGFGFVFVSKYITQ